MTCSSSPSRSGFSHLLEVWEVSQGAAKTKDGAGKEPAAKGKVNQFQAGESLPGGSRSSSPGGVRGPAGSELQLDSISKMWSQEKNEARLLSRQTRRYIAREQPAAGKAPVTRGPAAPLKGVISAWDSGETAKP